MLHGPWIFNNNVLLQLKQNKIEEQQYGILIPNPKYASWVILLATLLLDDKTIQWTVPGNQNPKYLSNLLLHNQLGLIHASIKAYSMLPVFNLWIGYSSPGIVSHFEILQLCQKWTQIDILIDTGSEECLAPY